MSIPRSLYRIARRQLLGEGVINYRGRGIINLIDVGSAGDLPSPWEENANKIGHLLKFEPRDRPSHDPSVTTVDTALWEVPGERRFYIYRGFSGTGSSLFEQNYEFVTENFEELRTRGPKQLAETWLERSQLSRVEGLDCRTLDDVIAELEHLRRYHFLKIDAQGAEYEILRGSERFLTDDCQGLHLELFVLPLYKGIRLLPEVTEYLAGIGFELAKKFPPHGTFDSQHDCVFLKKGSNGQLMDTIRSVYGL